MLLSLYGRVILKGEEDTLKEDELKEAPLLVTSMKALRVFEPPTDWSGPIYSSIEILQHLQKEVDGGAFPWMTSHSTKALDENIYNITMPNNHKQQISVIPYDSNNDSIMFLLEDESFQCSRLLTDFPHKLDPFISSKVLREAIKSEIDVLYINDCIPLTTHRFKYQNDYILKAFVTIVKPSFVYCLSNQKLPEAILQCCREIDLYN